MAASEDDVVALQEALRVSREETVKAKDKMKTWKTKMQEIVEKERAEILELRAFKEACENNTDDGCSEKDAIIESLEAKVQKTRQKATEFVDDAKKRISENEARFTEHQTRLEAQITSLVQQLADVEVGHSSETETLREQLSAAEAASAASGSQAVQDMVLQVDTLEGIIKSMEAEKGDQLLLQESTAATLRAVNADVEARQAEILQLQNDKTEVDKALLCAEETATEQAERVRWLEAEVDRVALEKHSEEEQREGALQAALRERTEEVDGLRVQLAEAQTGLGEAAALREKVAELTVQCEEAAGLVAMQAGEGELAVEDRDSKAEELALQTERTVVLEAAVAELEGRLAEYTSASSEQCTALEALRVELAEVAQDRDSHVENLTIQKDRTATLEAAVMELEGRCAEHTTATDSEQDILEVLRNELAGVTQDRDSQMEELTAQTERADTLEAVVAELEGRLASTEQDTALEALRVELAEVIGERDTHAENLALQIERTVALEATAAATHTTHVDTVAALEGRLAEVAEHTTATDSAEQDTALEALRTELAEMTQDRDTQMEELTAQTERTATLEVAITDLETRLASTEQVTALEALRNELAEVTQDRDTQMGELTAQTERTATLEAAVTDLEGRLASTSTSSTEQDIALDALRTELAEMTQDRDTQLEHLSTQTERTTTLEAAVTELETRLASSATSTSEDTLEALRTELAEMTQDRDTQLEHLSTQTERTTTLEAAITDLETRLASTEQDTALEALRNELAEVTQDRDTQLEHLSTQTERTTTLEAAVTDLEGRLASTSTSEQDALETLRTELAEVTADRDSRVAELTAKVARVKEKATRFLGEHTEEHASVLVQEAQKRKEMQDMVDNLQAIAQEKTEQAETLQASRDAITAEVEEKRLLCAEVSQSIETLQATIQDLKAQNAALTNEVADHERDAADHLAAHHRERTTLSEELRATHEELAAHQAEQLRFKKVNKSALLLRDQQLSAAKEEAHRLQEQLNAAERDHSSADVTTLQEEVEGLQNQLSAKYEESAKERRHWQRDVEEVRNGTDSTVALNRAHMDERVFLLQEAHHRELQELEDRMEVAAVAAQLTHDEDVSGMKRECDRFRDAAAAAARSTAAAEQEMAAQAQRLQVVEADLCESRKQLAGLASSPPAQQRHDALQAECAASLARLAQKDDEIQEGRDELALCRRQLLEVQTQVDKLMVARHQSERKSHDLISLQTTNKTLEADIQQLKEELKTHRAKLLDSTNDMYLKSIVVRFLVCTPEVRAAVLPILVQLLALSPAEVKEIFSNNPEWMP